jgi:hypothetical protein
VDYELQFAAGLAARTVIDRAIKIVTIDHVLEALQLSHL